jgi:hypothetical protein
LQQLMRLPSTALLAAFLLAAWPAGVRGQVPVRADTARFEEGILEVVAERLPPLTVIVLIDSAGSVLLPVRELIQHLGYTAAFSNGLLELPGLDGKRILFDSRAGLIIVGNDTVQLAPAEIAIRPTGVFLRSSRLGTLVQGDLAFNAAALSMSISRRIPFPAQQRLIAEQRRAMLIAHQRRVTDEVNDSVPYPAIVGGGVLDWELSTVGADPRERSSARIRTAVAALGGDLAAGMTLETGTLGNDTIRDLTLRYHRVFPRNRTVSQMRAGNIITNGIFARFVRGVEFTNRPYLQDHERGEVLLRPDLPAGWDYEVFQGNQLLGYSEPGARAAVSIPLRAGTTPVQVRMLGPAGEEIVFSTLVYQAPVSMLAKDRVEYVVAAGRCDGPWCTRFANADVRYGATSLITVGGGLEHVADSADASTRAYALASFTTGTRWTGEIQLMPQALYSANVGYFPGEGSAAHLRASQSRPGFGPVSVISADRTRWDTELTWDQRLKPGSSSFLGWRMPFGNVRLGSAIAGSAAFGLERWRMSASGSDHRGWSELRLDREINAVRPTTISARTSQFVPVTIGSATYRPMINVSGGVGSIGVRLLELGASVQPRGHHVISAAMLWTREQRQPSLTIGWSARLGAVQAGARIAAGRSGASTAATLSGSTAVSHAGQLTTRPVAMSGYGGLHGVVFVDHDGDGRFSAGDEVVPDIALVAGGIAVSADARGRYFVWGLQPYAVSSIAVDSARIPDPSWSTAQAEIRVRPAPNVARRVDIALVQTREVVGSVIATQGVATAGGITLLITRLGSGETTSAVTFSDGQFYISRLRPGSYRLEVAPSSLQVLGARGQPADLNFTVHAGGHQIVVELPPIRLIPAP